MCFRGKTGPGLGLKSGACERLNFLPIASLPCHDQCSRLCQATKKEERNGWRDGAVSGWVLGKGRGGTVVCPQWERLVQIDTVGISASTFLVGSLGLLNSTYSGLLVL